MTAGASLGAALILFAASRAQASFPVGLLEPVPARVAAEGRAIGLVSGAAPIGAESQSAGAEHAADWMELRFLAARAAVRGAAGIYFRLPPAPPGKNILDYPEEWQAFARVAREHTAIRPVIEQGQLVSVPFPPPPGIEARAWMREKRRYVLLVNVSGVPVALDESPLAGWRALFAARANPADGLSPCGERRCLPVEGVLWLEGRLFFPELP